jgi:uncharacterized protein YcbK (DUF882 family)
VQSAIAENQAADFRNRARVGFDGGFPSYDKIEWRIYMRAPRKMSRYSIVATAILCLLASSGAHGQSHAAAYEQASSDRAHDGRLVLFNTHTGERLDIVFRRGDDYVPDALAKLDYFLRDHRTGDVRHFDPRLFDILSDLTAYVGHPGGELDIVCGYRTPSTNESLRAHTTGVAKNSLHIQAEAIDLRMPGIDTLTLRRAALGLRRGGVGYYPHSDFIHVDVGRPRQWCFDCPANLISGD